MSLLRVARKIGSFVTLTYFSQSYQKKFALLRITAAQTYVSSVQKLRLFAFAIVLVLLALVLFISGLILLQMAIFQYSSLSAHIKFNMALVLGFIEFVSAVFMMFFLFKESTWIKFMEIEKVIRSVVTGPSDHQGGSHETKASEKKCP